MRLDCVLVACNDNPKYLKFWQVVKRAWWQIVGVPCILVYVADTIPEDLKTDPAVRHFKPIPGWPTATQAQCIRLLYPALLKCEGAVLLSDMDMIPMQAQWFKDNLSAFDNTAFVSLRGKDEHWKQIYMCYVAATPQVWSRLFKVHSEQDVRFQMEVWAKQFPADGTHGGLGWCTDQTLLYMRIAQLSGTEFQYAELPWTPELCRLDRGNPQDWIQLTDTVRSTVQQTPYVDFHMPPWEPFQQQIQQILEWRLQTPWSVNPNSQSL